MSRKYVWAACAGQTSDRSWHLERYKNCLFSIHPGSPVPDSWFCDIILPIQESSLRWTVKEFCIILDLLHCEHKRVSSCIIEEMVMKSFVISVDAEISRVSHMSAQIQEIFILPALFFFFLLICQIKSPPWRDSRERWSKDWKGCHMRKVWKNWV